MIVAPAVDLHGGRCVQLVGGVVEEERVSLPDPAATARSWSDHGFDVLHIVDLDAALGLGDNRAAIRAVADATPATLQVGGGLRDDDAVRDTLAGGAERAIVGTRAIEDPKWLEGVALANPGKIMVAADIRGPDVVVRGWTAASARTVAEVLASLAELPLAGVLITDVAREGRLEGIDGSGVEQLVGSSSTPIWIAGGITSIQDLEHIESVGAAGAVLGMAIYTGAVDPQEVAARWGSEES